MTARGHQLPPTRRPVLPTGGREAGSPGILRKKLRFWGLLVALIFLCIGFSLAAPGFATILNMQTIANRSAVPLVLAVGMTFILIHGSIDLSMEGIMGVSSLTFAMTILNSRTDLDFGLFAIVLATLTGAGFGAINGLVVTRLRVPSFMVTLGVWSFSWGVAMLLSGGRPPLIRDQMWRSFGLGKTVGIPNLVVVALVCLAVGYVLQAYTRFGRYSFVIGGGEDLARLSGVPVDKYKVLVFVFSGFLAGLASVMEAARIGVGHSSIGLDQMFATITAVVIGGTPLSGGQGGVIQSAIGVLTLAVLANGMIFIGVSPYLQKAVQGAIVIIAVVGATWHLQERLRVVK
jgi:ribose transport system permease protein